MRRVRGWFMGLSAACLSAVLAGGCVTGGAGRTVVSTPDAPAAIGPYSQGVRVGGTLYVAGQIALDPRTGRLVEGGVEAQTRRAMENVRAILRAGGFGLEDVVQVQVFLADLGDYARFNEVYAEFFRGAPPARAVVQVSRIPRDALVEVMVVAAKR
ncbi:MAG TPA: RidA family protein [Longimicrobiaceae bacterium]|nr:RidA family protein [Longimicrobiaceae bacterium]